MQIKIADFGLSIDSKSEIANTRLGTIDYLAPEILDCPVKQHPLDHKACVCVWGGASVVHACVRVGMRVLACVGVRVGLGGGLVCVWRGVKG